MMHPEYESREAEWNQDSTSHVSGKVKTLKRRSARGGGTPIQESSQPQPEAQASRAGVAPGWAGTCAAQGVCTGEVNWERVARARRLHRRLRCSGGRGHRWLRPRGVGFAWPRGRRHPTSLFIHLLVEECGHVAPGDDAAHAVVRVHHGQVAETQVSEELVHAGGAGGVVAGGGAHVHVGGQVQGLLEVVVREGPHVLEGELPPKIARKHLPVEHPGVGHGARDGAAPRVRAARAERPLLGARRDCLPLALLARAAIAGVRRGGRLADGAARGGPGRVALRRLGGRVGALAHGAPAEHRGRRDEQRPRAPAPAGDGVCVRAHHGAHARREFRVHAHVVRVPHAPPPPARAQRRLLVLGQPRRFDGKRALLEQDEELLAEHEARKLLPAALAAAVLLAKGDGVARVLRVQQGLVEGAHRGHLVEADHRGGGHVGRAEAARSLGRLVGEEGDAGEDNVLVVEALGELVAHHLGNEHRDGNRDGVRHVGGGLHEHHHGGHGEPGGPREVSRGADKGHGARARVLEARDELEALPQEASQGGADDDGGHEEARGGAHAVGEAREAPENGRQDGQLALGEAPRGVEEGLHRAVQLREGERAEGGHLPWAAEETQGLHGRRVEGEVVLGRAGAREVREPVEHRGGDQGHGEHLEHLGGRRGHAPLAQARQLEVERDEERAQEAPDGAHEGEDGHVRGLPVRLVRPVKLGRGPPLESPEGHRGLPVGQRHALARARLKGDDDHRSDGAEEDEGGEARVPVLHRGRLLEHDEHAADRRREGRGHAAGGAHGDEVALGGGLVQAEEGLDEAGEELGQKVGQGRAREDHGAFLAHDEVARHGEHDADRLARERAQGEHVGHTAAVEVGLHLRDARALGPGLHDHHAKRGDDHVGDVDRRQGAEGRPGPEGLCGLLGNVLHLVELELAEEVDGLLEGQGHGGRGTGDHEGHGHPQERGVRHVRLAALAVGRLRAAPLLYRVVHFVKVEAIALLGRAVRGRGTA
mmetsp:Transcript_8236/g.27981  ORF Transcript_8236/g.27981 Transcript_8236/m.27981 type:complete len:992 (-) Transcript_8236:123-3098(-)